MKLWSDNLNGFDWSVRLRSRRGSTMDAEILIKISGRQNEQESFPCRGGDAASRTEEKRGIE